ncbi:MAG: hypothetical protein Aureis2KO_01500 [Aureisphaera sp.]
MRYNILLIVLFGIGLSGNAQKLSYKDSTSILFKSKLLTVSEFGIGDKQQILNDLEGQKAQFLENKYENFVFVKVVFDQPYRLLNQNIVSFNRNCSYYLAYNIIDSRYYRLGGFGELDIDSFFKDLKLRETTIFKSHTSASDIEGINIYCLYDYYRMKDKKRMRKGYECFDNCKNVTESIIIVN